MAMNEVLEGLVAEFDAGVKLLVKKLAKGLPPEVLLPLYEDIDTFPAMSGTLFKRLMLFRSLVLWYNLLPGLRTQLAPPANLLPQWEGLGDRFQRDIRQSKVWLQGLLGRALHQHRTIFGNAATLIRELRAFLANRGTTHREGYLLEVLEILMGSG